jgi:hypothetical protein
MPPVLLRSGASTSSSRPGLPAFSGSPTLMPRGHNLTARALCASTRESADRKLQSAARHYLYQSVFGDGPDARRASRRRGERPGRRRRAVDAARRFPSFRNPSGLPEDGPPAPPPAYFSVLGRRRPAPDRGRRARGASALDVFAAEAHLRAPLKTRLVHELALAPRTIRELQALLRCPGESSPPVWELKRLLCETAVELPPVADLVPLSERGAPRRRGSDAAGEATSGDATSGDAAGGAMVKPEAVYDLMPELFDPERFDSPFSLEWGGYDYDRRAEVRRRRRSALGELRRADIRDAQRAAEAEPEAEPDGVPESLPRWLWSADLRTRVLHTLAFEQMTVQHAQAMVRVPGRPVPSTRKLFLALVQVAEKAGKEEESGASIFDLTPAAWDEIKAAAEEGRYGFKQLQIVKRRMKAARYRSHQLKMARRRAREKRERDRKTRLLVLNREKIQRAAYEKERAEARKNREV